MALPDYVGPVIEVAGVPALAFVVMRYSWTVVRAVLALVAGIVAIATRSRERRDACLAILDKVATRDDGGTRPVPRRYAGGPPSRRRSG